MKNVAVKEKVVEDLGQSFAAVQAAYLVEYKGCKAEAIRALRRELNNNGASMLVIKNTLAKRAIKGKGELEKLSEFFQGPTAVIWSEQDAILPAKIIFKFSKSQELFKIKAGIIEGGVVDGAGIESVATLPSREELICKLLALINTPATQLLRVVNAPAQQLVRLLGAWKDKLESKPEKESP